jgi:RNA polymerase sigma-70 factor (ECF subfamily)
MAERGEREPDPVSGVFPTTIWSQVRPLTGSARAAALETLAHCYQGPAEAFLGTALGLAPDAARELFQEFFVRVLETDFLERADPSRGRFRAFLKVALRRFWTDELRRRAAEKRGGGAAEVALDAEDVPEPVDRKGRGPDQVLDDAWRASLVDEAFQRTRRELESAGRAAVFEVFREYYLAPGEAPDYRTLAQKHEVSTTDVSNHLMRAKRLFREHLRALVLDTVSSADDLEHELRWVFEGRA